MAKKVVDEEPMLEESSDEILLEETSGEETLLEESADSETLLEESGETEVLLEESSDEVLLEESANPESQHQTTQKPVSAVSTLNKNTASRKRSATQGKTTQGKTTTQETHTKAPSGNTSSSSRQISSNRPKAQSNEPIDLPIWGLAFVWGFPMVLTLGLWIYGSHGLGVLVFFLVIAIATNIIAVFDENIHEKGQTKYFVIPLIILILICGIVMWLGKRSSMNQPATKETYTYINDRFLVNNVFIVEINDGDTLLNLKNQGLCELVDDHLYERIKPKYDSIGYFAQSTNDVEMFIIKQDGKYGLVDKEDEELVEPKYMRIEVPDEEVKTQDGDKLFKAYTNNTTELYSYAPKYYGQLQDK